MRWLSVLTISGIMVVGTVLRCWNISQSFWWDELWSTLPYATAPTIRTLFCDLGYYFNNHAMYSLLCRFSIKLLGESEFSARMPALVMGLITLWVLFRFSKRYVGVWPGLVAAFLLAISAFHIDHSTEARGYTGMALFSLLATHTFFQALRTNKLRDWGCHILCVVVGFYFHTFMIAVCVSHFCCVLLFFAGKILKINSIRIEFSVFRNYMISQVLAAITTILLYVPLLDDFLRNMQKVRMVVVDRIPFLLKLLNMVFPGSLTVHGAVVYGALLAAGMLFVFKKDKRLCLFIIIAMVVPITLFLSLNPMFMYERYFIYALPFALLILGCGICQIAGLVKKRQILQILFILLTVTDLTVLQFPLIKEMNLKDRQNYREAVRYVENMKSNDFRQTYVFALGYAGVHFNYYAKETVYIPSSYEEFKECIKGKKYIWCLLTGWLPELRPPHEDVELYKEEPEHVKIYDYVQKHFEVNKTYSDRYLTKVYFLRRD